VFCRNGVGSLHSVQFGCATVDGKVHLLFRKSAADGREQKSRSKVRYGTLFSTLVDDGHTDTLHWTIRKLASPLAQMKGFRVNAVAPGPIWTPLIPSTMPEDAVKNFGRQVPWKRAGQPAELAMAYVMLADPLSSYTSGTTVAVTGGKPFI
jgi:hypothetical protein